MTTPSSGPKKLSEFPPAVLEQLRTWVEFKIDAIKLDPVAAEDLHKINWAIGRRSILDEINSALTVAAKEQVRHKHGLSERPPH